MQQSTNIFDPGMLPPSAVDLEKAVLGALMMESDAIYEVSDILHPDIFYKDAHRKIAAVIK